MVEHGALAVRERARLLLQREIGRALGIVWVPIVVGVMRFVFRWKIVDAARIRHEYRHIRAESDAPLVVCANHLTMLDSAVVAWALGSPGWYLRHFSSLPWNVPEWRNFGSSLVRRVLVYLMRCIPITRGSNRADVASVLERVRHVLLLGDVVLIFPEGGRARSGRVEVENAAHGVGRIVGSVPGCRVLCLYVRGEGQRVMSDVPARGETFHVRASLLEPRSSKRGVRASLEISRQIVEELSVLEKQVLGEAA